MNEFNEFFVDLLKSKNSLPLKELNKISTQLLSIFKNKKNIDQFIYKCFNYEDDPNLNCYISLYNMIPKNQEFNISKRQLNLIMSDQFVFFNILHLDAIELKFGKILNLDDFKFKLYLYSIEYKIAIIPNINFLYHCYKLKFTNLQIIDHFNFYSKLILKNNDYFPEINIWSDKYNLVKFKPDDTIQLFLGYYIKTCNTLYHCSQENIAKLFTSRYFCSLGIYKNNRLYGYMYIWKDISSNLIIDCISSFNNINVDSVSELILKLNKLLANNKLFISDATYGITDRVRVKIANPLTKIKPIQKEFTLYSDTKFAYEVNNAST
jgi:hypothetical protein